MKRPKDSPRETGQRVLLRGRGELGTVVRIDEGGWVWINWDEPKGGPDICHVNELALQR